MFVATTFGLKDFMESEKASSEEACLSLLDKGDPLLGMASDSRAQCQVINLIKPLPGCRRPLKFSVIVPKFIPTVPREPLVNSVTISVSILCGAGSDVLQPLFYETQIEERQKRLDILARRSGAVFAAIVEETAVGMLAPFST